MSLAAAAIQAGASIAGGLLSNDANYQAEMRNYENTRQLMKEQNDFNVRMWNATNRYNSPSNQLELLKQAGLNPAVYDFGGGHSAASEVTAASGTAPYNQDAGRGFREAAAGISQAAASTIQALQVDAQIAKLRTDIKYQNLKNRELDNQLKADEAYLPDPETPPFTDDGNGNYSMIVYPPVNRYQERRARERLDFKGEIQRQNLTAEELDVYRATAPYLKKIKKKEFESLVQDVRKKIAENTLVNSDVNFLQKYGISPHDADGWTTLLKLALRNPNAFNNIVDNILKIPENSFNSKGFSFLRRLSPSGWLLDNGMRLTLPRISHRNP